MYWLRRFGPLVFLAVLSTLEGCGGGAADTAKPTMPDPRTSRTQKREDPVRLIAPPPAYGNKIVQAARDDTRAVF